MTDEQKERIAIEVEHLEDAQAEYERRVKDHEEMERVKWDQF